MAMMIQQPWQLLLLNLNLFFVFCFYGIFVLPPCHGQNIETFYPFTALAPAPAPAPTPQIAPISPSLPPPTQAKPQPLPVLPAAPQKSSSNESLIAKAVGATAACTLVVSGLLFFLVQRFVVAKRRRKINGGGSGTSSTGSQGGRPQPPVVDRNEFARYDGNLKGFIVDENGLDVLYWRKLEERNSKKSFNKEVLRNPKNGEEINGDGDDDDDAEGIRRRKHEPIQEVPLLRGKSSSSHINDVSEVSDPNRIRSMALKAVEKSEPEVELTIRSSSPPPPPSPPPTPPPPPLLPPLPISNKKSPAAPPPPPPPSTIAAMNSSAPPPPPPPKPKARSLNALSKPSTGPKGMEGDSKPAECSSGAGNGQVKLKPLHWDKVNTNNTQHSMVWDKIDGSFSSFWICCHQPVVPQRDSNQVNPRGTNVGPSPQICILDARKSQNIAIVIKSLTISRKEILDVLMEGRGLNAETLEKLARIAPTEEEQSQILEYNGDPTRLADAECFLYHILKAVPTAFTRLNAMLFRYNYDLEILNLKESLRTLELGCKELRTRGLFMKLLEAILKAGNRMNAGTSRGNAQAFNLSSLRKLSDVRSSDGKTTLLHFVVEEVIRSEGKRCVINTNHSLSRSSSQSHNRNLSSENLKPKEDREKEYMMLGLPMVGGISAEFSNVKKAAAIDYDSFAGTCSALTTRVAEIRELVIQRENNGGGRFVREMKAFLEAADEELTVVREQQKSVMELVKKQQNIIKQGLLRIKGHTHFNYLS
ncbi:unnamed protein product [Prunus armeniaca]|uniref:Formin-like protein n=1 Tax=Prunus armeniaca TaxID=36596 RepID=A0A6J5TKL5_PRUAR|nr:unnamed protein product [Prunus armeniaca]